MLPRWSTVVLLSTRNGMSNNARSISLSSQRDTDTTNSSDTDAMYYDKCRKRLAEIMGCNPSNFTNSDVRNSLEYLFPTAITDSLARPILKYSSKSESKDIMLDQFGRPRECSFYTGSSSYYSLKFQLHDLSKSETINTTTDTTIQWIKQKEMELLLEESLTEKQYQNVLDILNQLRKYDSSESAKKIVETYQGRAKHSPQQDLKNGSDPGSVVIGHRKSAKAHVQLIPGGGSIRINSKSLLEYFPRLQDRQQVLYPLICTGTLENYDIQVDVAGGGMTGQAGAIRLGISRSLNCYEAHKNILEQTKLLINDPRTVERKKPGQKKARKKFAWVKR